MTNSIKFYGLWTLKILTALAFLAAGISKLLGVEMMVATFDAIGIGQWFRYLTGGIEIAGAILLFVPRRQSIGATLLAVTMVGAITAHLLILGPSALPATMLLLFTAIIAVAHRDQLV